MAFQKGNHWAYKKGNKPIAGFKKGNKIRLGLKSSKETIEKLRISHLNQIPWNKGIPCTDERKKNISKKHWIHGKNVARNKAQIRNKLQGIMPKSIMVEGKFGHVKRGWFDINGKEIFFRSKWEANYALYLNFLIKQKEIIKWEYEKEVFIFHKIQFGTRSYRPDFKVITKNKNIEYHEVKGWMTSKSKVQLNRMRIYYPKIKIILIDSKSYADIKNKIGRMLKFY